MNEWQTLIGTLAMRQPPTPDELRDAESKRKRSYAIKRRADGCRLAGLVRQANNNNKVVKALRERPGMTADEVSKYLSLSRGHCYETLRSLREELRIRCDIGAGGRKFWYAK